MKVWQRFFSTIGDFGHICFYENAFTTDNRDISKLYVTLFQMWLKNTIFVKCLPLSSCQFLVAEADDKKPPVSHSGFNKYLVKTSHKNGRPSCSSSMQYTKKAGEDKVRSRLVLGNTSVWCILCQLWGEVWHCMTLAHQNKHGFQIFWESPPLMQMQVMHNVF